MRKFLLIVFIGIINSITSNAQNLITNGGFEDYDGASTPTGNGVNSSCIPFVWGNDFQKLAVWEDDIDFLSTCYNIGPRPPYKYFHSPDWYKLYNPPHTFLYGGGDPCSWVMPVEGNSYVGMGPYELFQQEFQNGEFKEGIEYFLKFKMYLDHLEYNYDNIGLRVYAAKNRMEYKLAPHNCQDICRLDYVKIRNGPTQHKVKIADIGNLDSYQYNTWIEVVMSFNAPDADHNWFAMELYHNNYSDPGQGDASCLGGYILIDDISLSLDCCHDFMLYQNVDDELPEETHVEDYIKSGENVGVPFLDNGPVTILSGHEVGFYAGNSIVLENGFSAKSGSKFQAKIEPCDKFINQSGPITLLFPREDQLNGEVNWNRCCGSNEFWLAASGATDFFFSVDDNRNQNAVFTRQGKITANTFPVWDGKINGQCAQGARFYECGLRLWNCVETREFSIVVFVNSCDDPQKKGEKSQENVIGNYQITPNPAANNTFISFSVQEQLSVDLFITDCVGREVATLINNEEKDAGNYRINFATSELSPGIYFCTLKRGDLTETKKIIKVTQ